MKYIASFSGGKDSTAMVLKLLEEGEPLDEIIFCDTGKEFPQMYRHIEKVRKYIKEKYNMDITILKNEKTFDYYMFEHVKTRGKNIGQKGYGWCTDRLRWCTDRLKNQVVNKYLRKYKENYVEYVGIAADETEREREREKCYPLIRWGMTEKDCLAYCYSKGFDWEGLYEHFDRVSCWCCPLKRVKEYRTLYKYYPELWKELKDMDKRTYSKFKPNYPSVQQLEDKFKKEEK